MPIDWFVWLTPLILLPLVALFVFVGCDVTGVVGGSDPGLMVKAENLYSTAWFRTDWTFYRSDPFADLGIIGRPNTPPYQKAIPAGNPYQPDVQIPVQVNEPDLDAILKQEPDLVQCECIIHDDIGKKEEKVQAGLVPYKAGTAPMMIWNLSRGADKSYSLTPYKYV